MIPLCIKGIQPGVSASTLHFSDKTPCSPQLQCGTKFHLFRFVKNVGKRHIEGAEHICDLEIRGKVALLLTLVNYKLVLASTI